MASGATPPRADVHANRRKPLLQSFALKPGRVTVARLSQARNVPCLVLAGGEMLERPLPYCGTAGVVRFDAPAREVLDRLMALGLEHHVAFAYGEHRSTLRAVAARLGLPVVELT
jgi:L-fucose isomerase-like protein